MKTYRTFWAASALSGLSLLSPSDYSNQLQLVQQKIQRERAANSSASALYVGPEKLRIGDSWDVAAMHYDTNQMAMDGDPKRHGLRNKIVGIFHYEVTQLKNGNGSRGTHTVIRVTQKNEFGHPVVDPKVQELNLSIDLKRTEVQKFYAVSGNSRAVVADPTGLKSNFSILELFPLDMPKLQAAIRSKPEELPELPDELETIAEKMGYDPDLSQSFWYEQDDFFGRPVQFLWKSGDPWPSYLKTPHGIAILIRKGKP